METRELLKKVRKIEIKTKGLSKHIFSGEYHSAFKGRGMSFSEVREYQYGDDVRNIDWNVTARTGDPHIKVFEEERELTVMFLVDMSKSSFFGTVNQFKSAIITELCAVLAFSAMNNNDKVGAILFTDHVEKYIPPKKGKKHILRFIRELIHFEPYMTGTVIEESLRYLNNVMKKRCIAFVVSDFQTTAYKEALRIAGKKHDVIGMHIYDQLEKELPNVGLVRVSDAESEKKMILDTGSKRVREKYAQKFQDNFLYFRNTFRQLGLDTISVNTSEDYTKVLHNFFKRRIK
jgi:uncharacterized protein (DUF58 family)